MSELASSQDRRLHLKKTPVRNGVACKLMLGHGYARGGNLMVQLVLGIDEGSRFRAGSVLPLGRIKNISRHVFVEFFETRWKPLFGDSPAVHIDPAGAFRVRVRCVLTWKFGVEGVM